METAYLLRSANAERPAALGRALKNEGEPMTGLIASRYHYYFCAPPLPFPKIPHPAFIHVVFETSAITF
jgi:hypothetical protein